MKRHTSPPRTFLWINESVNTPTQNCWTDYPQQIQPAPRQHDYLGAIVGGVSRAGCWVAGSAKATVGWSAQQLAPASGPSCATDSTIATLPAQLRGRHRCSTASRRTISRHGAPATRLPTSTTDSASSRGYLTTQQPAACQRLRDAATDCVFQPTDMDCHMSPTRLLLLSIALAPIGAYADDVADSAAAASE